jgi:hypothetical protein
MGGAFLAEYLYEVEYDRPLYLLQDLDEGRDLKTLLMVPRLTKRV